MSGTAGVEPLTILKKDLIDGGVFTAAEFEGGSFMKETAVGRKADGAPYALCVSYDAYWANRGLRELFLGKAAPDAAPQKANEEELVFECGKDFLSLRPATVYGLRISRRQRRTEDGGARTQEVVAVTLEEDPQNPERLAVAFAHIARASWPFTKQLFIEPERNEADRERVKQICADILETRSQVMSRSGEIKAGVHERLAERFPAPPAAAPA